MKKSVVIVLLSLGLSNFGNAQNEQGQWSLELAIGQNNAIRPFGVNYASNTSGGLDGIKINHLDFGACYMLSDNFGGKVELGYDRVSDSGASLPFDTRSYRFGVQVVLNIGSVFALKDVSSRLGLLAHAGPQVGIISYEGKPSELTRGFMFGITPQVWISDRVAITGDFTVIHNRGQNYNWDGSAAGLNNNLDGMMYTTSLGLSCIIN